MPHSRSQTIKVLYPADIVISQQRAKELALEFGFSGTISEEIALAVKELASNLIRHAPGGRLILKPVKSDGRAGLEIETVDNGPGIENVNQALTDGFSTGGGLGYGLGTVNRLMDELEIISDTKTPPGTRIICRRWRRGDNAYTSKCPIDFGIATRPFPGMTVNGDAFVCVKWNENVLAGVIDGLGHGQFAHQAAETARGYVENHYDQPLETIFNGVGRACQGTRGVVMALALFEWSQQLLTFASIGNIEARLLKKEEGMGFIVRRGILGVNAPKPVVTRHRWNISNIMVLHSDGVKSHWNWNELSDVLSSPASIVAGHFINRLARESDDATVIVVKEK